MPTANAAKSASEILIFRPVCGGDFWQPRATKISKYYKGKEWKCAEGLRQLTVPAQMAAADWSDAQPIRRDHGLNGSVARAKFRLSEW